MRSNERLQVRPGAGAPSFAGDDSTLQLADGRELGYMTWGNPGGNPLLYFGGSRLEAAVLAESAVQSGVQLIGVDRPGMGRSSFQPGRRLVDWPGDVAALADHLQLDRFAVVGVSAGGPHALACALLLSDRLSRCGVVSGVGPVIVRAYQRAPWLLQSMTWLMGRFFRDEDAADRSLVRLTRSWPAADRTSLLVPGIQRIWASSLAESFRRGARGMRYDSVLVEARPWGFDLGAIEPSRLFLWHGELDPDVPVAMGRAVAERLVGCTVRYLPDDGHLSVIVNHGTEIVHALCPAGGCMTATDFN